MWVGFALPFRNTQNERGDVVSADRVPPCPPQFPLLDWNLWTKCRPDVSMHARELSSLTPDASAYTYCDHYALEENGVGCTVSWVLVQVVGACNQMENADTATPDLITLNDVAQTNNADVETGGAFEWAAGEAVISAPSLSQAIVCTWYYNPRAATIWCTRGCVRQMRLEEFLWRFRMEAALFAKCTFPTAPITTPYGFINYCTAQKLTQEEINYLFFYFKT